MKSKFKLLLLLQAIPLFIWSCKPKCSGENPQTNITILTAAKNALAGFPQGTIWIFQSTSSTTEKDTIIVNNTPNIPMDEGSCVDKDCCSKYYYEHLDKDFQVKSTSSLNNFTGYTLKANGFNIKSSYRVIPIENGDVLFKSFPGNSFKDNLSLSISGKTLNDIVTGGEYNNDTTLVICYWSAQFGLVKYSYKTVSGTIIKEYERIDLP